MAGSALARSPSRGQARRTPRFSAHSQPLRLSLLLLLPLRDPLVAAVAAAAAAAATATEAERSR